MTLDLGTTSLSQARLARGLTLEDAERSTRISRKFLIALEEHDYSVFPAPVYARGFLRTYCRFLGIDPEVQLAELPAGWTENAAPTGQATTNLKAVKTREPWAFPSFNLAWVVAGAVLAAVIGLGIYVSRGDQGLGSLDPDQNAIESQVPSGAFGDTGSTGNEPSGQTAQPAASPTQAASNGTTGARALQPGLPGTLPDFRGVAVNDVTAFLTQQDITYLRIDTTSSSTAAGLVISQSPAAGSDTDGLDQVTLTVSIGATQSGATRTNCAVLEASNQRTAAEQAYFETNCGSQTPATLPDRTSCEEIRGTDYRSPSERTFFLANCIIQ